MDKELSDGLKKKFVKFERYVVIFFKQSFGPYFASERS